MIEPKLVPLNIPPHRQELRRESDGTLRIYDGLRDKWLVLTPEEWVRQHFVSWLTNELGYPRSFVANEVALKLNSCQKRSDTVVFAPDLTPLCIVEYKAPTVALSQKVFDQIVRYNMVFKARCLIVSNGLEHYCCAISYDPPKYSFLSYIPTYEQLKNLQP